MVEWKKLGEICEVQRGKRLTKNLLDENAAYPVYHGGLEPLGKYGQYNREANTVMVINVGASAGTVGFSDCRFWSSDGCFCISHSELLDNKFLFYYLQTKTHYLQSQVRHAGIPTLDNPVVEKINLPLLSLSEQNRIVGILDTFTASIDNLKEQIAQRRKQYEHYRDQLLDLEGKEGVEMKTLGEIGEFIRGNGIQKNDFVEEGFGCIHYGQIHAKYGFFAEETISKVEESLYKKCKKAQKGDVVLATTSEDAEGVAKPFVWLGNEKVAVSGDAFIFHHNQNGKFIGHQFLTHKFMQFKIKYATGAKVVRISGDNMAKFEVALPAIEKQNEIVDILDKFEASIQNLEAQLSQREKQYEYYRNKLLTFE
jgi:type I restriction enzyme S subunit